MVIDEPSPGSPEAVSKGCTCPLMENRCGSGVAYKGKRAFYLDHGCPVHCPQPPSEADVDAALGP